jgi:TetR/AcrR family transcriptional regulator, mexJK operon transcriptional repressor
MVAEVVAEEAPGPGKSDRKRRAILQAGKAVFLRRGFGGTTMDAVAATARVSKMTVYRHFGSKEDLFAGVITELCGQIVEDELEQMLERSPPEALCAYARKIMAIVFAPGTVELHRIVVAESRRFPKLGRYFYANGPEMCIATLAAYLKRNRNNPKFKVRNPRRAAEEFLELLRGYAHLRVLLGIEKTPPAQEIDARIESAIRHILTV